MSEKITLRSEEVRVKFHPDMKKRVDRIATMHGTPTATWCHMVIAQAVVAFERTMQMQNKAQDAMVSAVAEQVVPALLAQLAELDSASAAQVVPDLLAQLTPVTTDEAGSAEGGVKG